MDAEGDAHNLATPQQPAHVQRNPDSLAQHISHISAVEPAPALVSGQSPEVQVQLVQPGVEELMTPRAEDIHANRELVSGSGHAPAVDYFTPAASSSHSVESPPTTRRQSIQVASLPRLPGRSAGSPDVSPQEHSVRVESALARNLAAHHEAIAAVPVSDMASPTGPAEDAGDLPRLQPRRSVTDYPISAEQSLLAHQSPELLPTSPPSRSPQSRSRPGTLTHLRGTSGDRQARTAGNTPIQTPKLYSPRAARPPANFPYLHEQGTFPSPYLHPAQPQAPKETSKATRDVDTFSGRKTINQYEIQSEIGKGTHGKVKLARSLDTGDYVAIKIVQRYSKKRRLGKASSQEDQVKKEIAILKKALHPNVVSMIEVIDDPDLHKIYLVLEFCELHDVKWRTPGESEILLMEHRRLQREMKGEHNLDVAAESDRIMRAAIRRNQVVSRQRRAPLSRINSQDDFCWSLEYAGDSADEEDHPSGSDSMSRISTRPESVAIQTGPSHESAGFPEDASPTNTRFVDNPPFETQQADDTIPRQPEIPEQPQSWDMRDLHTHLQQRMSLLDESGETDARARQPSLAESSSSQLTEMMEDIIDDGELRYVPLLTLAESRRAFRDALLGLEYLHYQGIVHRDIKPENLLRKADQSVKISDFGVSYLGKPERDGKESEETSEAEGPSEREAQAELAKTVGTPAFYAPELCTLTYVESDTPVVTGQIDVWALGVVLYCLLYARLPYPAKNEFRMMRRIADDDVFISRKRLRAVASRPGSHSPAFRSQDHRLPHELSYEDIDDDLYDLLKRIFQKDPEKRIKVKEMKHHPWILKDIPNPLVWQEETDPARFTQGKKIEISTQEVADAVIPLKILERARSVAKKVQGVLGLGPSKPSRKRGQSSANSSEVGSTSSAGSGTGTGTQRESVHSDEGLATAPKPARDPMQHHQTPHHEHPLSQSVTASPEHSTGRPFDEAFASHPPAMEGSQHGQNGELKRPALAGRQESAMSTAASIKTIRQSDIQGGRHDRNSSPHEEPHHSHRDILSATSLGAIFGGAGRSLMRSMSRSRRGSDSRASSTPPSPRTGDPASHLHGEPSTAVSNASASGVVQQPAKPSEAISHSPSPSPYQSKRTSLAGGVSASGLSHAIHEANFSHQASPATSSPAASRASPVDHTGEASDAEYYEVRQQLARRRLLEEVQAKERSRPPSALSNLPCPPSPDDENPRSLYLGNSPRSSSFLPLSPVESASPPPRQRSIKPISSNSSEDHFTSGISQSTSYPSIPSVISANSSVLPDKGSTDSLKEDSAQSSEGTAGAEGAWHKISKNVRSTPTGPLMLDEHGQHLASRPVVDSDEDDSDDGEGFLVMGQHKSKRPITSARRPSQHASSHRTPHKRERRSSNVASPTNDSSKAT